MITNTFSLRSGGNAGLALGFALMVVVGACNRQPDAQSTAAAPAPAVPAAAPAPAQPAPDAVVAQQDDYVYYPEYEVYYSNIHHHYIYRDGSAWVTRPAPPRVSVDVLFASPSVRLDFHDAPERHHETIVHTYPRNWTPPGWHGRGNDDRDRKDDRKDRR